MLKKLINLIYFFLLQTLTKSFGVIMDSVKIFYEKTVNYLRTSYVIPFELNAKIASIVNTREIA